MTSSPAHKHSRITLMIFALACAIGFAFILFMTSFGPGLRDDSYTFLSAAEFLTTNGRYARPSAMGGATPVSNFPPGYSLLLTIPIWLGVDPVTSASIVNAFLFAALILSTGALVLGIAKRGRMTIAAVGLLMTASELIQQFTWAQSEPLFLSLMPLAFLFLFYFLHRKGDTRSLISTAVVLSITSLARYSGLSLVIASILLILIIPYAHLKQRIKDAVRLALISSVLTIAFLLRNLLLLGNLTNRPAPYWHPPDTNALLAGLHKMLMWFVPDRIVIRLDLMPAGMLFFSLSIAFVIVNILIFKGGNLKDPEQEENALMLKILFVHMVVYALFVMVTIAFLDVLTPLNDRILSPLRLMLIFEIIFLGRILYGYRPPLGQGLSQVMLAALLTFQIYRTVHLVDDLRSDGQGYSESTWRFSETLTHVCTLPDVPLYSNDLPAIYFLCDRLAKPIPAPLNLSSQTPNIEYAAEVQRMREDLMTNQGYLIILGWYDEPRLERLGIASFIHELNVDMSYKDGLILSY